MLNAIMSLRGGGREVNHVMLKLTLLLLAVPSALIPSCDAGKVP